MGHQELTDLEVLEDRDLQVRKVLQERLELLDLPIIREQPEVQEHQSQDPRESEPPDLQATQ